MSSSQDDLVRYRIDRSRESLDEARLLADSSHWNASVNRLYYACFYAVSALLFLYRFSSPKHSGVRALFNQHFVRTGHVSKDHAAFYNTLYDFRQESDYEDFFEADAVRVASWLEEARMFIDAIEELIKGKRVA